MPLDVRPISPQQHLAYVAQRPAVSFLQTPSWGGVKAEWGSRSLGWFEGDKLVGAGLVLTRKIPKLKKWLAYVPEGPDLDWAQATASPEALSSWLDPMLSLLKRAGAFQVKIGPTVAVRKWHTDTLKNAIAGGTAKRLRDVAPDETLPGGEALISELRATGWTQRADTGAGFGDVQPRYVFAIPLLDRTEDELFANFNQLWRRNIRKADKLGVSVELTGREGLEKFHPIYVQTAVRDGFVPRGLPYFQRMWDAMSAEDSDRIKVYLASYQGDVLAATTMVTVGDHAWYSYGASADVGREVRPANAIQWRMIKDAKAAGCSVYDMRGISDTLDEKDPLFGLIRFKLGTGGQAVEYVGEWDYALRPALAKAFDLYLRRSQLKASAGTLIGKPSIRKPSIKKPRPTAAQPEAAR